MKIPIIKAIVLSIVITLLACTDPLLIKVEENGVLLETYEINNDSIRHGITKKYYSEGHLYEMSNYENGKLHGERLLYYPDGTVEIRENHCQGKFCDSLTTYYKNGAKKMVGIYTDGSMNGIVKGYYDTGELKEEVTFNENIEQGPFREYHKNGSLMWTGTYLNGPNEFGILMEYDESEKMIKKMMCDSLSVCTTVWPPRKSSE